MKKRKTDFAPAEKHAELSTGEVIRMLRELKDWSQDELARRSGINPANLSALENGRLEIGKKRVEQLAGAFNIHPAIIMFPEYEKTGMLTAAEAEHAYRAKKKTKGK